MLSWARQSSTRDKERILPYDGFFGLLKTTAVGPIVRDVVEEIDMALA